MSCIWLAYDLRVRSGFNVPGATLLDADSGPCEIVIEAGEAALGVPRETRGLFTAGERGIRIETPSCALLCTPGGRILVDAAPGAALAAIEAALAAFALPTLMWMRGDIVLHAGAAVLPGGAGALAILGSSGAGKSTLLRQLLDAGATIVSDDTLSLRVRGEEIWVSGLPALLGSGAHGDPAFARMVPSEARTRAARLAAICVLRAPDESAGGLTMLDHRARTLALIEHRYRVKVPRLLGRILPMLPDLAHIAFPIGGAAWQRPQGAIDLSLAELQGLSSLCLSAMDVRTCPSGR
jgi:hypothetical protein